MALETRRHAKWPTREEIIEVVTHLAFYSGWPTASTALSVVRSVFEDAATPATNP